MKTAILYNYVIAFIPVPKVQFDKSAYSVHEPSVKEQITTVVVRVLRTGADNQTSSVRCSTRDGSAQSGFDYNARSLRVTFPPGKLTDPVIWCVPILWIRHLDQHRLSLPNKVLLHTLKTYFLDWFSPAENNYQRIWEPLLRIFDNTLALFGSFKNENKLDPTCRPHLTLQVYGR